MHPELRRLKYRFAVPSPAPLLEGDALEPYCNRATTLRSERMRMALQLRAQVGDLDPMED